MKKVKGILFSVCLIAGLSSMVSAQNAVSAQYMQAGNSAYAAKNYDQAIQYYQAVVNSDPNNGGAYQGLGNCYYVKGNNTEALSNYQKALDLNPNNAQLSQFVQSFRAKVGATTPAASSPAASMASTSSRASTGADKKLEIDIQGGLNLVLSSLGAPLGAADGVSENLAGGYGVGFGLGAGAYYAISKNISLGANVAFSTYSANYNYGLSYEGESEGITETASFSAIEVLAAGKYHFDGTGIKPYLLAGVGIADVATSSSVTVSVSGEGSYGTAIPSVSTICPMFEVGGGVQIPAGPDMDFFGEAKIGVILVGATAQTVTIEGITGTLTTPSYTFMELPINVGLAFNL